MTSTQLRDAQIDLAFGRVYIDPEFAHQFLRLRTRFLEFAEERFRHARFFLRAEADFDRGVPVVLHRYPAKEHVIAGRDHGHRTHPTIRVVNAGHADFLS